MATSLFRALLVASLGTVALSAPSYHHFASRDTGPYMERLQALGLLGAHFGPIDLPESYDYIVLGGGTAGLAIARRLAEGNTVAVIEAGGFYEFDNANLTEIPADASYYLGKDPLLHNPLLDWQQYTTPQKGFNGVSALYPSGHTLGGGSTRNFMWYQRGSTGSYQKWANMVNDTSYLFPNFLKYFQKSVKFTPPQSGVRSANATPMYNTNDYSSSGGPLEVGYPAFASPAATWVTKGLNYIGLKQLPGMEDGNLFGWTWIANTITPYQKRSTSENSFLRDAFENTLSLQVYENTIAKKILFDSNKKATGVVVESVGVGSGSTTWTLNATKEVIVSSGAFRSPQLLMVSGIGPAATLQSKGIPVIADLPGVGQNMWDHIFYGPTYDTNVLTHSYLGDVDFAAQANQQYLQSRTGILTNVGGDLLAFEKLPNNSLTPSTRSALDSTFGPDWPDIEILSLDAWTGTLNDFLLGAPAVKNYTAVCIALVSPFSRGNVTIASNDTMDHPIVNPNWLSDPRDQEVAIAAFKRARAVFAAPGVQPILVGEEAYPGPQVTTDQQILEVVMNSSSTIHHAAGTCRMGVAGDKMAVLDSSARVFGVQGLRVVDASAFPLLPPGHPQATVYALAEKIADKILTGS